MKSRMQFSIRTLVAACAGGFAVAIAAGAFAADAKPSAGSAPAAAAPATAAGDIPELSEIMVRGKRLRDAIADAEDDFFAEYNKVNKDHDFDTRCVYVNTGQDSQIKSRFCIPGFMADALADQVYFQQQCQSPGNDENGNPYPPPPCYTPPSPQLVLMKRSKEYANHMMSVIRGNVNLQTKAGRLDQLYYELLGVQQQYLKAKAATDAAHEATKASQSPRAK
jgi:hypothetical protein